MHLYLPRSTRAVGITAKHQRAAGAADPHRVGSVEPRWPTRTTDMIDRAKLPEAAATQQISAAPLDVTVTAGTAGMIAHNRQPVPVYAAAGSTPIAWLPPQMFGAETRLPIIDQQPGWVRVLLPSRPNGSTGWITTRGLEFAHTPHEIRVHRRSGRLQLFTSGRRAGTWRVRVGAAPTATPMGRTFLLATPAEQSCPPWIPLGLHSSASPPCTRSPGLVAIHRWLDMPDEESRCPACIHVPADTFEVLAAMPRGSLVRIYR
ncbi:L,D-transpeptidase [Actinoplanes aureus]|uniref:L,D-transpeptidase n=1 Tax=Actinoplanes aureus TaxID=2792083 RepID=A0A931CFA9_9ACTN|nr:L,D-transpeptidase [Actinoplanes aureus]MBG0567544.1 L,D-transpeptidase [Actinoplanes aureus]